LRFQVFREGKALNDFNVAGAYLFGTDSIAVRRAEIKFSNGFLECTKQNLESAGLTLLWPVKNFGQVLLPTTCLPDRERPYNLNVELARGKLMQIVNKCEDWAFFTEDELGQLYQQAQSLFIKALLNISDMPLAAKLADEALVKALVFGEQIALIEAEKQFKQRGSEHSFGRGCLGCSVDPKLIDKPSYLEKLLDLFGYAAIPINWAQIEPEKGRYDFSQADKCVLALQKKRIGIGAGPLLRFNKQYLPKWLLHQKPDFEKIRESAYHFISEIVGRYSGKIRLWSVISGLNRHNYFGFNFEQTLEITRAANMAASAVGPRIRKIIEVEKPWGEYYAVEPGTIPPLIYMDMVIQSGVNFDAFGLKMGFEENGSNAHSRDMMQISTLLDYIKPIAKPFYITGVTVPSDVGSGTNEDPIRRSAGRLTSEQTDWLTRFYKTALSKPFIDSVVYSNLADVSDSDKTGLLNEKFEPKQLFKSLKKIQKTILGK